MPSAARKSGTPLCLAIVDADHFDRINDSYVHQAGDKVLSWCGSLLR
jgi:diguanylate cyclase (GGDEF)-like protein